MNKRAPLTTRTRTIALFVLCAAMTTAAFANFASAFAAAEPAADNGASVTTDKTDYQPGETVVISGSGFAAGETINITLKEDPANHPDTSLTATADEYGNFFNKEFSPNEEHRGTTFNMTAVGQTSGRSAEYKFTDGNDYSYSVSPNPATFNVTADASPHSVVATVTVIAPDSGPGKPAAGNVVTVAQQVVGGATPIPAAWLSITPATLTFNTSPQSLPWTVTVTVPPFAAAGTYSSTLKANPPPGKGGAGAGSTITVVVTGADTAAPNTTLTATTPPSVSYNGVNWTNQDVTIALSATDTGTPASGVASTKYRVDGLPSDPYTTYTAPFVISAGGLHVVTYFSIDNIGNTEGGKTFTVKIDKTKPVITLNGAADMTVTYGSGPFTDPGASATDSGGSLLAGAVVASGSVNTSVVGDYTINYNVSDNAGNAADTVSRTVHVVKADQTISFAPLADKTFGGPDFNVSATSGSGDAVTFTASGNCSVSGSTVHITGAGSCTITAHQAGNASYNAAPDVPQSFNIAKAATTTTVTCGAGPFTYSGAAQTPCSANVTGPGLNESVAVNYTDNTNAGTATASASYAESDNYLGSSDSETFEIGKAASTTDVTCGAGPFTYDGSPQTPCSVSVSGAGGLNLSPSPNYSNNTNAGTANASYTYAGDANHDGSSNSTTFEIAKASSSTVVSCPSNQTYTGSAIEPCTATVTGAGGLNQSVPVSYSDNVNAGSATASATYPGDANHDGSNGNGGFTIDKAPSVTDVTCASGPFTYSGSAVEPCTVSVTGASLSLSPAPVYADNVNAGTASASYNYAGDANHTGSSDSETFEIGKAATVTTVTCGAGPFSYTGSAQTPCSAAVTGPGGLNESLSVSYSDNVNAGTATASASYAESANYLGSSDSENFAIGKAATTTTVVCGAGPFSYTGSAITPCSASVTGPGGLNQSLTVSYTDNTNAGTAGASAAYAGDSNYEASSDTEGFAIGKAATVTTVTCGAGPFTYNGAAQTPCSASVTGPGGLNQSLSVSYSDNTNAGSATASANYAGDSNYLSSSDSKNFAIGKANATINVTGYTGFYDGAAHGASGTATGVLSEDLSSLLNFGSTFTNVPGGTANWTFAGNSNYNSANGSVSITIKSWTASGFYQPVDMGGVLNTVKGGSTVPLKFELFSGTVEKTSVADILSFQTAEIPCGSTSNMEAALEVTSTGGTVLRYDTTGGQFIQNWQTPKTVNKCYQVRMTAKDGSKLDAFFKTK